MQLLKDLTRICLTNEFGIWLLVAGLAILWTAYNTLLNYVFAIVMALAGYPSLCLGVLGSRRSFARFSRNRRIGLVWFIQMKHLYVVFACTVILTLSYFRAVKTGHSLELARGSALIVILSVISIVLGAFEARAARRTWEGVLADFVSFYDPTFGEQVRSSAIIVIDRAQIYSTVLSAVIALIGTVLWAYGDEFLACGVFRYLGVHDNSGTVCL